MLLALLLPTTGAGTPAGEILYRRAVGLADREAATPLRENTLFRLASLTKPLVSVAALGLVSEGALELDAPLTRWLPDFRPRSPDGSSGSISVRHLLTHTSGLGYGLFDAEGDAYARARISIGLDQPALSFVENAQRICSVPSSRGRARHSTTRSPRTCSASWSPASLVCHFRS